MTFFATIFYLDWRSSAFERLDVMKRQRILSVERFISIDLIPHPGNEEEYARDLRRLANFYASKYKFDKALGQAQWSDLERAE